MGRSAALHCGESRHQPSRAATRVLIAPLAGVGRDYPLSIEKLSPVLSWYVVQDWREGCERCKEILRYGGMGHTMSIHSRNEQIILEFGLKKPAFRIVVNTPTTHGSVGMTTGLDPAMTLGCGGWGGNITSDNISPKHLLNIKRLAYEITPAQSALRFIIRRQIRTTACTRQDAVWHLKRSVSESISFLPPVVFPAGAAVGSGLSRTATSAPKTACTICLRRRCPPGAQMGHKIVIDSRTIVTPAARDLGEEKRIFIESR